MSFILLLRNCSQQLLPSNYLLYIADKYVNGYLSIGHPVSNNVIYILDEKLQCVNCGELGEIYVSGANVIKHYLHGMYQVLHLKNLDILPACNSIDEQILDISNLFQSRFILNALTVFLTEF